MTEMAGARKTALIIVKSDPLRDAMKALFSLVLGVDVVGVAEMPSAGLTLAAQYKPDIIVLDSRPDMDIVRAALHQVRQVSPRSQRIFLADDVLPQPADDGVPAELVLLKGLPPSEVLARIQQLVSATSPPGADRPTGVDVGGCQA
jgi:DNA-binding NarL/FixJ family response regulator